MKRLFMAVIALSLPIIAQEKPIFTQAKIKQATVTLPVLSLPIPLRQIFLRVRASW